MAQVTFDHVAKVYPGGVRAVKDLSLQVADGELVALVGPSGSGKTTILRLIAGLEEPTAGTIGIGGRVVNRLAPRERDVALMFQRHGLYPHLRVRDNLAFGLRLRHRVGWPQRLFLRCFRRGRYEEVWRQDRLLAERVGEAARTLGLEELLDRFPAQLSGGQQQRTALGRALVRRPAVFLLDEPLGNLDARLRAELRHELHLLHCRLRATMVYVTHDQVEAMTLGERVVVLDRGVVQQVGRPAEVYERPRNRFVAGFIGWPAMNFVDGRLVHEGGRLRLEGAGWALPLPPVRAAAWASHHGREVTLGIRPDAVRLTGDGRGEAGLVMAVALVEPLGGDCLVTFGRADWQIVAKMKMGVGLGPGQAVEVRFDMRQAHLFDRGSGAALGYGPEG
jgi:multiple sugar transport system ATP-binding protein